VRWKAIAGVQGNKFVGTGGEIVSHDLARRDDKSKRTKIRVSAHERCPLVQWLLRFKPLGSSCVELFFRRDCGRRRIAGLDPACSFMIRQLCQFWNMGAPSRSIVRFYSYLAHGCRRESNVLVVFLKFDGRVIESLKMTNASSHCSSSTDIGHPKHRIRIVFFVGIEVGHLPTRQRVLAPANCISVSPN